MFVRVPIISAYDPSREIMLAYASPSYKIAIVITGLVIDCLGTNNFGPFAFLPLTRTTYSDLPLISKHAQICPSAIKSLLRIALPPSQRPLTIRGPCVL